MISKAMFCIADFCDAGPCRNGGTCRRDAGLANSARCLCSYPYQGALCDTVVTTALPTTTTLGPCALNPCNSGRCTLDSRNVKGFNCSCDAGWVGDACEWRTSVCEVCLIPLFCAIACDRGRGGDEDVFDDPAYSFHVF